MFIDTHCHILLDNYDEISSMIEKIKESGVERIIVNGCDLQSNIKVLDLIKRYDIVYGAIGFHPTELQNFCESHLNWLEENINNEKIVAIGEIGLDYHYDDTDVDKQKEVFRRQLDIASKYNKPIIVHTRDAIQDTYDILKNYSLKGSIHCFSGSYEMAINFIKLGFLLGFGGVCTYKNAKNVKNVIKNIDLEYILLETDSPYLTPEPYRMKQNTSAYLPLIARKIANIKGVSVDAVARVTTNNARICFFDLK